MNGFLDEVRVFDMMKAREKRAELQAELIEKFGFPVVCVGLNIAGAVKTGKAYLYVFNSFVSKIKAVFKSLGARVHFEELCYEKTGYEAFFSVEASAGELKQVFLSLEETESLGRLVDIDIVDVDFKKLSRPKPRPCLVCGRDDLGCSARRSHDVKTIIEKTDYMILAELKRILADKISKLAQKALLYELSISPKPGLVDRLNNGSHEDMDFFKFIDSSVTLKEYFERLVFVALDSKDDIKGLFQKIKALAMLAENEMLISTDGKNTHKGAIFHIGLAAFSCARIKSPDAKKISEYIKNNFAEIIEDELKLRLDSGGSSFGLKAYKEYGISGARGQAIAGYSLVVDELLPLLNKNLNKGYDYAGLACLLKAILSLQDSTAIKRCGLEGLNLFKHKISKISSLDMAEINALDRECREANISFGGAADMLALSLFFMFLEKEKELLELFALCP